MALSSKQMQIEDFLTNYVQYISNCSSGSTSQRESPWSSAYFKTRGPCTQVRPQQSQ